MKFKPFTSSRTRSVRHILRAAVASVSFGLFGSHVASAAPAMQSHDVASFADLGQRRYSDGLTAARFDSNRGPVNERTAAHLLAAAPETASVSSYFDFSLELSGDQEKFSFPELEVRTAPEMSRSAQLNGGRNTVVPTDVNFAVATDAVECAGFGTAVTGSTTLLLAMTLPLGFAVLRRRREDEVEGEQNAFAGGFAVRGADDQITSGFNALRGNFGRLTTTALAAAGAVLAMSGSSAHGQVSTVVDFNTQSGNHGLNTVANYYNTSNNPIADPTNASSYLIDIAAPGNSNYIGVYSGNLSAGANFSVTAGALAFDTTVGLNTSTNAAYYTTLYFEGETGINTAINNSAAFTTMILTGGNPGTPGNVTTYGPTTPVTLANDLITITANAVAAARAVNSSASATVIMEGEGGSNATTGNTAGASLYVQVNSNGNFDIAPGGNLTFFYSYGLSNATGSNVYTYYDAFITGNGYITVTGGGLVYLEVSNSGYNGAFSVTGNSTLKVITSSELGPASTGGPGNSFVVGNSTYTFNGQMTTIDAGTLEYTGANYSESLYHTYKLTSANSVITTDSGYQQLQGIISGNGTLNKFGAGTLYLNPEVPNASNSSLVNLVSNFYTGGTVVNAGTLELASGNTAGTGPITLNAGTLQDYYSTSTIASTTIANSLVLNNSVALMDGNGTSSATLSMTGLISGNGTLNAYAGAGTIVLGYNGASTYSGGTNIDSGTVALIYNGDLGSGSVSMNGGALYLQGSVRLPNALALTSTGTISAANTTATEGINGIVSGSTMLYKTGVGSIGLFNANNTYTGGTTIAGGTLPITGPNSLGVPATGLEATITTGTLSYTGSTAVFSAAQTFAMGATTSALLVGANSTMSVAGAITDATINSTSVPGTLNKVGAGTLILSGVNSYSGGTNVTAGVLVYNGTDSSTSGTVNSIGVNSTLAGSGTLTAAVSVSGTITGGSGATANDTTGTLTTGAQTWNSGGTYFAKVDATGLGSDKLVMSNVSVSSGFNLVLTSVAGATATPDGTTFVLAKTSTAADFTPGQITFTYSGLTLADPSASVSLSEQMDGSGEDLIAVVAGVPEPTTIAMLAVGTPMLLRRRRRARIGSAE